MTDDRTATFRSELDEASYLRQMIPVHVDFWVRAVRLQEARARSVGASQLDWQVDATLYAIALRDLLRVDRLARRINASATDRATARFNAAVPGACDVRNVLEHFDDYEIGAGRLQKVGAIPRLVSVWFEDDGERVVINLPGGLRLDLSVATHAAEDFADAIRHALSVGT